MSGSDAQVTSAKQHRIARTAFRLWTGPLAWIVQLCVGEALVDWPCFPSAQRLLVPLTGYGWSGTVAAALLVMCAALAFVAGWQAWREWRGLQGNHQLSRDDRARFIALWGAILGIGFGVATLATLVAFAMVPQCLG
jgi:hypothetical protein